MSVHQNARIQAQAEKWWKAHIEQPYVFNITESK